ncbi:hypothetical protein DFH29DRAFT_955815, partial [Suillus ampliporus]
MLTDPGSSYMTPRQGAYNVCILSYCSAPDFPLPGVRRSDHKMKTVKYPRLAKAHRKKERTNERSTKNKRTHLFVTFPSTSVTITNVIPPFFRSHTSSGPALWFKFIIIARLPTILLPVVLLKRIRATGRVSVLRMCLCIAEGFDGELLEGGLREVNMEAELAVRMRIDGD